MVLVVCMGNIDASIALQLASFSSHTFPVDEMYRVLSHEVTTPINSPNINNTFNMLNVFVAFVGDDDDDDDGNRQNSSNSSLRLLIFIVCLPFIALGISGLKVIVAVVLLTAVSMPVIFLISSKRLMRLQSFLFVFL